MAKRLMGIRVSDETWNILKAKAEEEGRTPSDLARFLLETTLGLRTPPSRFGLGVGDTKAAYTSPPSGSKPKKSTRKPKPKA